jgi:hypothetical protein
MYGRVVSLFNEAFVGALLSRPQKKNKKYFYQTKANKLLPRVNSFVPFAFFVVSKTSIILSL